jgi:hypothetical protein
MPDVKIIGLSIFQEDAQTAAILEAGAFACLANTEPSQAVIETASPWIRIETEPSRDIGAAPLDIFVQLSFKKIDRLSRISGDVILPISMVEAVGTLSDLFGLPEISQALDWASLACSLSLQEFGDLYSTCKHNL